MVNLFPHRPRPTAARHPRNRFRPKKQRAAESEADYGGEYDGAEDYDETDSEDDGPPWDEDGEE